MGTGKQVAGGTMGIIDRISSLFSSDGSEDEAGYRMYVRCDRCGEKLGTRVNLYNDLSVSFSESGDQTYLCRKTIVGRQACFERIEINLIFNKRRKLIGQEITGGTFIKKGEYTASES